MKASYYHYGYVYIKVAFDGNYFYFAAKNLMRGETEYMRIEDTFETKEAAVKAARRFVYA